MLFLIEVAEFAVRAHSGAGEPEVQMAPGQGPPAATVAEREEEVRSVSERVTLHSGPFKSVFWADESDLKEIIDSGRYPREVKISYDIMLEAFAFYKRDFVKLETLKLARQNETLSRGHGY